MFQGGYTGVHCGQQIDECLSNPCRNNATCTDGIDMYACNCTPGNDYQLLVTIYKHS